MCCDNKLKQIINLLQEQIDIIKKINPHTFAEQQVAVGDVGEWYDFDCIRPLDKQTVLCRSDIGICTAVHDEENELLSCNDNDHDAHEAEEDVFWSPLPTFSKERE